MNDCIFDPRKEAKEAVAGYYRDLLKDGVPKRFEKAEFDSKVTNLLVDELFEGNLTIEQVFLTLQEIRNVCSYDSDSII